MNGVYSFYVKTVDGEDTWWVLYLRPGDETWFVIPM